MSLLPTSPLFSKSELSDQMTFLITICCAPVLSFNEKYFRKVEERCNSSTVVSCDNVILDILSLTNIAKQSVEGFCFIMEEEEEEEEV